MRYPAVCEASGLLSELNGSRVPEGFGEMSELWSLPIRQPETISQPARMRTHCCLSLWYHEQIGSIYCVLGSRDG